MSQTFAPRRHTTSVFIIRFSSIFRMRLEPISNVLSLDWHSCAHWFSYTRRVFPLASAVICSRKTAFSVFSAGTSFTAASRSCWVSLSVRVNKVTALSISDDKESSFSFVVRRSSPRCRHTKHDQKPSVSSFDISRHLHKRCQVICLRYGLVSVRCQATTRTNAALFYKGNITLGVILSKALIYGGYFRFPKS